MMFDLPRDKPPPVTLQRVALRRMTLYYDDLRAFGFTSLHELEIEGARGKFIDTLALFEALGGTPRSAALRGQQLVICAEGSRKLLVSFKLENSEQYYTVFSRAEVRANIRLLALEEPPLPLPAFRPHYLFPADEFPVLETLVLAAGHPLLDLDTIPQCGTLRAPMLRRLAIIKNSCGMTRAERNVHPLSLAVLIEHHLDLAPGRELDGDHGIALCEWDHDDDDEPDVLQTHVSTITHRYQSHDTWPGLC